MPHRRLRLEPLCLRKVWTTSSHRPCLWPSTRSTVSASASRAVVAQSTRYPAAWAVLPDHLHRVRSAAPLVPLTSQAGLPEPVLGLFTGPQTPCQRPALPRHDSARLSWHPAYLGPTIAISSPHPLHRPWRRTLTGPCGMVACTNHLLCPRARPVTDLPRALQTRDAYRRAACTDRSTRLAHLLERAEPGHVGWCDGLHLPRALRLQSRHLQPAHRRPEGPPRHLHLPTTREFPSAHHPPRRPGVYAPLPPPCPAGRLHAGATLWLYER